MAAKKKVSKKRAAGKATRKARAKSVQQAAAVKRLSRTGGAKREPVKARLRKRRVLRGENDELSPSAVRKWTG